MVELVQLFETGDPGDSARGLLKVPVVGPRKCDALLAGYLPLDVRRNCTA